MKLATIYAVVLLDAMDAPVDPAVAHFVDDALAREVAEQLPRARVDPVEAIVLHDGQALPRLGGPRVILFPSAAAALAAWRAPPGAGTSTEAPSLPAPAPGAP